MSTLTKCSGTHGTLHILIVEDNKTTVKILEDLISKYKDSIIVTYSLAESLEEARAKLDIEPVDVTLLDLTLPDSEGLQTLTKLFSYKPSIPIVVFTGADSKEWSILCLKNGAQDFIYKPDITTKMDIYDLIQRLSYAVARAAGRKEAMEACVPTIKDIEQTKQSLQEALHKADDSKHKIESGLKPYPKKK